MQTQRECGLVTSTHKVLSLIPNTEKAELCTEAC